MALADILGRILEEAWEEARDIRAGAETQAEAILAEAGREAAARKAALVRTGEKNLEEESERELARKRRQARREVFALKRQILDGVFQKLPALVHERSAEQYARLLVGLIDEQVAAGGPAEVQVGAEDIARYGEGFPSLVARELSQRLPGWKATVSPVAGRFARGLMISSGRVLHNLSFESLLEEFRTRIEPEVARVLFSV